MKDLKTDQGLLKAMRLAYKKMTPQESFEQRVSFVYGSLSHGSKITKDQVRRILESLK